MRKPLSSKMKHLGDNKKRKEKYQFKYYYVLQNNIYRNNIFVHCHTLGF